MVRYVGCCGRRVAWEEYSRLFDAIEVDSTFYRLPRVGTARRWAESTGGRVIFCIKAFQGITHPISSPTWRRAGVQRPKVNTDRYGHLKPTEENFACWDATLAICRATNARICVVQLPPSFICSDDNVTNTLAFFSSIKRDGIRIGMEFRHRSWMMDENRSRLLRVLDIGVMHIVDPFTWMPAVEQGSIYCRLHGRLSSRYDTIAYEYSYRYSDDDLARLKQVVGALCADEVFVMFNNINMHEDALRFRSMLYSNYKPAYG
ncbi:MAG: DUF72 domain-containing protein [Candidatus Nitrosocaldus sp.]|nr:DUF72 domain-containing protein [Candidatus Nitrosocaldus sp.]MDW8275477.1 DUF72 domain-containing protein [Candidatus Nitrosocaldus sp.]